MRNDIFALRDWGSRVNEICNGRSPDLDSQISMKRGEVIFPIYIVFKSILLQSADVDIAVFLHNWHTPQSNRTGAVLREGELSLHGSESARQNWNMCLKISTGRVLIGEMDVVCDEAPFVWRRRCCAVKTSQQTTTSVIMSTGISVNPADL